MSRYIYTNNGGVPGGPPTDSSSAPIRSTVGLHTLAAASQLEREHEGTHSSSSTYPIRSPANSSSRYAQPLQSQPSPQPQTRRTSYSGRNSYATSSTYHPQDAAGGYASSPPPQPTSDPSQYGQYDQQYDEGQQQPEYQYQEQQPHGDYVNDEPNPFEQPIPQYSDSVDENGQPFPEVPLVEPIPEDIFNRSKLYLYFTYFFAAWGDRMWEFAAIIFIIDLYPTSLFYSSFFGLVEKLVTIIFGPAVGRKIDQNDRLETVRWTIVGQNVSVFVASVVFFMALSSIASGTAKSGWIGLSYFFILVMGAIAEVASSANKIAIHKDWVVVLAGDTPTRLTQLNSNMRRIDLVCSILAPLLVGLISLSTGPIAVAFVGAWSCASLFIEYNLVGWVYANIPALHHKVEKRRAAGIEPEPNVSPVQSLSDHTKPLDRVALESLALMEKVKVFFTRFIGTMREYRAHPVFLASFAYSILYISVLSMGGIMASWLKLRSVSNAVIAVVRGLAALVAVGSTYCVPYMVKRWGLIQAGLIAIWAQVAMLLPVAFTFVYYFTSFTTQLVILFVFLCLSRFGLWSFDLCETQIMQQSVDRHHAGVINGAQESMINVFYVAGFLLTIIFANPDIFAIPVFVSFISVIIAAITYTTYASNTLGTSNPFPALETFKLNQPLEYQPNPPINDDPDQNPFESPQSDENAVEVNAQLYEEQQLQDYDSQQPQEYTYRYEDETNYDRPQTNQQQYAQDDDGRDIY